MVFLNDSDTILKEVVQSINATTSSWRLGPLSPKWVFVNASLPINTLVNDTFVVQRKDIRHVGTLPLDTFAYLIISVVVILALVAVPNCKYIVRLLLGNDRRFGTDEAHSQIGEYAFDQHINETYPPPRAAPLPSYQETTTCVSSEKVGVSEIRDCQSMMRQIYGLRVDVFNAADIAPVYQEDVANWRMRANAGLRDIQATVERWGRREDWSAEEKEKIELIRQRIDNMKQGRA